MKKLYNLCVNLSRDLTQQTDRNEFVNALRYFQQNLFMFIAHMLDRQCSFLHIHAPLTESAVTVHRRLIKVN